MCFQDVTPTLCNVRNPQAGRGWPWLPLASGQLLFELCNIIKIRNFLKEPIVVALGEQDELKLIGSLRRYPRAGVQQR